MKSKQDLLACLQEMHFLPENLFIYQMNRNFVVRNIASWVYKLDET